MKVKELTNKKNSESLLDLISLIRYRIIRVSICKRLNIILQILDKVWNPFKFKLKETEVQSLIFRIKMLVLNNLM